jgi:hypothetical protein
MRKPAPIILRTLADVIKLRSTWVRAMEGYSSARLRKVIAFKSSNPDGKSSYEPNTLLNWSTL